MRIEAIDQGFNLRLLPQQLGDPEVVAANVAIRRDLRTKMSALHDAAIRRESDKAHLQAFLARAESLGLPSEINPELLYAMNFAYATAVYAVESLLAETRKARSNDYEYQIHRDMADRARLNFQEYHDNSTLSEERRAELAAIVNDHDFAVTVIQVFEERRG